ncbi:MAG: tripartite tricarboxylate transporter substrate-binding protein [Polaromonas sp.]|nr:tripartite tricarboxylate transporter substrate-binding protein [Polaromonas sp.]
MIKISSLMKAFCRSGVAALAVAAALPAVAQDYPVKPVRVVVGYAAGGGADALARTVSEGLSKVLGQSFVVDNKPGAGGMFAADTVAKAQPDGYSILLTDTQYVISPALFAKTPFNASKDLTGVSLMTDVPLFIAVKSSSKITSLRDLIEQAKANPGKFNYGSAGIGSLHHIAMESFKAAVGVDIVHIPYKGSGQSVIGFLGDETTILVASPPSIAQHIKAGTVKPLAVTSKVRSPYYPDVPPIADVAAGFDFSTELGILAPAATPKAVINKLSAAIAQVLRQPEVVDRINNGMGQTVIASSPEAYTANIASNLKRYETAVKISGAKVE